MQQSVGYRQTRPHTEVFYDSSQLSGANVQAEKVLTIIGSAMGGEPNRPYQLTTFSEAREIFRGGELLDALELAWNPGGNSNGAGIINAIRVDEALQSELTDGAITFTSKLYGEEANKLQVEMTDNSTTDSKRLKFYFKGDNYATYDHLGNLFSVQYTGDDAQATITITESNGKADTLTLSSGADTGTLEEVKSYDLGEGVYEKVYDIMRDINSLPDFEADLFPMGDKNLNSEDLDPVEEQDIKADSYMVTALQADIENAVQYDQYIEVAFNNEQTMPETIDLAYLSGGENGTVPTSWSDVFPMLSDMNVTYIVPLTEEESIHAEMAQFISDQSNERAGNMVRGFVGGGTNLTKEELITRQASIRNGRIGLVGFSGERTMQSSGESKTIPGYLAAAQVAGIASGIPIGEPITYKEIALSSLDGNFTSTELDQLDANGIIMAEFVRNGASTKFRIASEVSTYNDAGDPVRNLISLGELSDYLATQLRDRLDNKFIGTRLRATSASIIKADVESFLDVQKSENYIVDYNKEDVRVVITGDRVRIDLIVVPARGIRTINVYMQYEDPNLEA